MSTSKPESAIILTNGFFERIDAKTAHGLVRGPSRYRIVGVVDAACAGRDAGELLDGRPRAIPIAGSVPEVLSRVADTPDHCVVGVATKGGVVPPSLRRDLLDAAQAGMSLVNGLHESLASDPELAALVDHHGGRILDIRAPRRANELRFWTGEVLGLPVPRVAVLGTDCALGKRTTCNLLEQALGSLGLRAGVVYTGQTGWLQGHRHGFIFDATPNDFVPGELEGAILDCFSDERPDVILLEGQSGLRNPSGPCGSELIVSTGAAGVVLQHAPQRTFFKGFEQRGARVPPLSEELELVRLLGSCVWAIGLHEEGLTRAEAAAEAERLERELGIPVTLPAQDPSRLAGVVHDRLSEGAQEGS